MVTEAHSSHHPGEATLRELEEGLRGELIRPGDPAYDEARAVWNGAHDRYPALIVRCAGVADVMRAVDFARSEDLPVAVRGGGHSLPGFSTVDDGIVIDLSPMRTIRVDPERRTATVEGGATWADVDHETQAFGLAVTGGLVSTTGVAGFTLGGGIGWLMRAFGLACDNLVGADVVTADGRLVHASAGDDADLLWGLRGGGGNFGIATSLEFRLRPLGPMVLAGPVFFAGDRAEELLRFYRDWVRELPDEMTTLINLTTAPPAPFLPEAVHGKPLVAIVAVHAGEPEHGRDLMAPLQALRDPVADLIGVMPYTGMQSLLDPLWERGAHNHFRSAYVDELTDDAIAAMAAAHRAVPSPQSEIHLHHFGGAVARGDRDGAFGDRSAQFVLNVIARQAGPEDFAGNVAWARSTAAALTPVSRAGAYVNFMSDAGDERLRAAHGEASYERLRALKRRLDPANFFRLNQNIAP